jgi:hypothetical protein
MSAYSDYISQVRRLLHDANGQFWTTPELLDYINAARVRTVRLTGCYRNLQNRNLTASQETYAYSAFTTTPVIDVINVTVRWGNSRIPLPYMPWSTFNQKARYWQSFTGRPRCWSIYSYNTLYVQPLPDQTYVAECDTVVEPPSIVDATTVEVLPQPFTSCVQYWAAHLAKIKAQAWGEAEALKSMFTKEVQTNLTASYTRRATRYPS